MPDTFFIDDDPEGLVFIFLNRYQYLKMSEPLSAFDIVYLNYTTFEQPQGGASLQSGLSGQNDYIDSAGTHWFSGTFGGFVYQISGNGSGYYDPASFSPGVTIVEGYKYTYDLSGHFHLHNGFMSAADSPYDSGFYAISFPSWVLVHYPAGTPTSYDVGMGTTLYSAIPADPYTHFYDRYNGAGAPPYYSGLPYYYWVFRLVWSLNGKLFVLMLGDGQHPSYPFQDTLTWAIVMVSGDPMVAANWDGAPITSYIGPTDPSLSPPLSATGNYDNPGFTGYPIGSVRVLGTKAYISALWDLDSSLATPYNNNLVFEIDDMGIATGIFPNPGYSSVINPGPLAVKNGILYFITSEGWNLSGTSPSTTGTIRIWKYVSGSWIQVTSRTFTANQMGSPFISTFFIYQDKCYFMFDLTNNGYVAGGSTANSFVYGFDETDNIWMTDNDLGFLQDSNARSPKIVQIEGL